MNVRAKMKVMAITPFHSSDPDGVCAEVRLMPVYSDSEENKTWSKWTPNGECRMTITNAPAIDAFEVGKEYYLDFTPA
jgi:hypothetical protein